MPSSAAYRFGMFCLGVYGRKQGMDFCQRQGIPLIDGGGDAIVTKTSRENLNTSAGFLVPDEFQNDLIDLREKFGVFRQNARIVPMASDTRSDPRRINGVTAYFVAESTAATQSDKTWDRVRLTAKKLMVLTKYSNELNEDAVLNIGDDLAGEIAYAFASRKTSAVSSATAPAPTAASSGAAPRCATSMPPSPTSRASPSPPEQVTAPATTRSRCRISTRSWRTCRSTRTCRGETRWYVSKFFWGAVMQKLAVAAGGNRVADIAGLAMEKTFLGYPGHRLAGDAEGVSDQPGLLPLRQPCAWARGWAIVA